LLTLLAAFVSRKTAEDRAALLWFQEQASIRNSLTRELNHRVKNTLANVLSIIALTRRRTTDVDTFADSLNGRIRALSATHDLLTQSEWGTTLIRDVVSAELAPYTQGAEHEIEFRGPDVELAPNDALSLGLAIHELATNAAKYGALSVVSGSLRVHWTMISSELARIEWIERGGPPVPQERTRGFGTELIEKIVAHELGRPVELRFEPGGVVCVLIVQVRKPVAFRMRAPRSPS
jgi:two-component sensor histidine kinase